MSDLFEHYIFVVGLYLHLLIPVAGARSLPFPRKLKDALLAKTQAHVKTTSIILNHIHFVIQYIISYSVNQRRKV